MPPTVPAPRAPEGLAWWTPFAAFLVAIGAGSVVFGVLAGVLGGDAGSPEVTLTATFIQDGLLIAAMIVVVRSTGVRVSPLVFGLRRMPPGRILTLTVPVLVVFYAFLSAWIQLDPGTEDDLLEDLGAKTSFAALAGVAVLTTLVAPLAEELFFRGFLFGALRGVMHWIGAAVIAGVLFGAIHLGTPPIFLVPLALLGFLLCVLYQRTDSLLPGMAVHSVINGLALSVGLEWSALGVLATIVVAPAIVLAIAAAVSR